ncbi:spore coat protein U domain-containing protein [Paraburkholderia ribeironis]
MARIPRPYAPIWRMPGPICSGHVLTRGPRQWPEFRWLHARHDRTGRIRPLSSSIRTRATLRSGATMMQAWLQKRPTLAGNTAASLTVYGPVPAQSNLAVGDYIDTIVVTPYY